MNTKPKKPFTRRVSPANYKGELISPVVIDIPHSGLMVPDHVLYHCPPENLRSLEDPYVHLLMDHAFAFDITMFINNIHRSVVDMNREPDEINPADVIDGWSKPANVSYYTRQGHGVIPMKLSGKHRLTDIYNKNATPSSYEIERRLKWYYEPYHLLLKKQIDTAHRFNGFSVHIDVHSMSRTAPFKPNRPDICLGTLNGASSHPLIDAFMQDFFNKEGLSVKFNSPFSGTTIVRNTSDPLNARYSIQLEIARDLYLAADSYKLHYPKAKKIQGIMTHFAEELDYFVRSQANILKLGYANNSIQTSRNASSSGPKPSP